MKQRIAFIIPHGAMVGTHGLYSKYYEKGDGLQILKKLSFGIGAVMPTLAAITPERYECCIIDEKFEEIDFDEDYTIVAITANTQLSTRAYEIADKFRLKAHVAMGGLHISTMPDEALLHADSIFIGEAENTWPEFLEDFEKKTAKKIYKATEIVDLNSIPLPRYDLVDLKRYHYIYVQMSRGCPHNCEFCSATNVYGRKIRYKNINKIIEEIEYIKNHSSESSHIIFSDDNFLANKKIALKLIQRLKEINVRWVCLTDISIAKDEELLELMYESGCSLAYIGLESLNPQSMEEADKTNWKVKQIEKYSEYIQRIQKKGILVQGSFIIGFDHDTMQTFKDIEKFIIDNNLYLVQFNILTPLPGTKIREKLEKENRILPLPWEFYTYHNVTIKHPNITEEQFYEGFISLIENISTQEVLDKKVKYFRSIFKNLV